MTRRLLTTGQAARILSVTPDTVLKWIKSGQVPATQTAGGHYRIRRRDLDKLRTHRTAKGRRGRPGQSRRSFQYCWEYNTRDGVQPTECNDCIVFRTRAYRCYDVLKLAPGSGHAKIFCKQTCEECDYYLRVHKQDTNVLVISQDKELTEALQRQKDTAPFNLEFTDNEYSCSALVESFRPDFAIIDCSLGVERCRHMTKHLLTDPRIPFIRVVLAAANGAFPRECDQDIFAHMDSPFSVEDIGYCITGVRNVVEKNG